MPADKPGTKPLQTTVTKGHGLSCVPTTWLEIHAVPDVVQLMAAGVALGEVWAYGRGDRWAWRMNTCTDQPSGSECVSQDAAKNELWAAVVNAVREANNAGF